MNQNNKVVQLLHIKRTKNNQITNKEKIVYAHHYFEQDNELEAKQLLSSVDQSYYQSGFHKDIARALLCHATVKTTGNPVHGKESEFYLIVYKLTKQIVENKIMFNGSGHFSQLRDELFKDLM